MSGHWILVANGEASASPRIRTAIAAADRVVSVDGGSRMLAALNITPHLAVGDMDSTPPELLTRYRQAGVPLHLHPVRKDATDLELALDLALDADAAAITILGATGGRLDHTLGNLLLLERCLNRNIPSRIVDDNQTVYLTADNLEINGRPGDLLSIIPVSGDVGGVTLTGLEYPLQDAALPFSTSLGLSNVFTETKACIRIRSGRLLVFHLHWWDDDGSFPFP
jgi:thiamine pyrophosphokinase